MPIYICGDGAAAACYWIFAPEWSSDFCSTWLSTPSETLIKQVDIANEVNQFSCLVLHKSLAQEVRNCVRDTASGKASLTYELNAAWQIARAKKFNEY